MQESILYNSDARVEMEEMTYEATGNATEVCFLKFLQDAEIPVHLLIQKKLGNIRAHQPFSSVLKRSIIAVRHPENQQMVTIYVKGAPEEVLKYCTLQMLGGQQSHFSQGQNILNDIVNPMASTPLRVITFAYAQLNYEDWLRIYESTSEQPETVLEDNLISGDL